MAVYVDDMEAPYRGMIMCHMLADTTDELISMAVSLGIAARHIQKAGTVHEHFDICKAKRARAVALGAIEIGRQQLVAIINARRAGRMR